MNEKFSWHKSGTDILKNQAIAEKALGIMNPGVTNDDEMQSDLATRDIVEGSARSDRLDAQEAVVSESDAGLRIKSAPSMESFDLLQAELGKRGEELRTEFGELEKASSELTVLLGAVGPSRFDLAKTPISSAEIADIKMRVELLRNAIPNRESQYTKGLESYERLERELAETTFQIQKICDLLAPLDSKLN
ncbi:MAG: hypothetical protein JWM20_238 [Patescibacteria group bacterium]|nr:hypothetical protein [Patescibacteria group bacterium]